MSPLSLLYVPKVQAPGQHQFFDFGQRIEYQTISERCLDWQPQKKAKPSNNIESVQLLHLFGHCTACAFCFGSASIVGSMMALQFQPRFIVMLDHVAPCVMFWHFQGSMNWNMIAIAAIVCNCDSFKIHSRACSKSAQDTEDSGCQWLQKM